MKTICPNTLLALGGSSIEGQTMVFNSFVNHDYVSDMVRSNQSLFVDLYFIGSWLQGVETLIVFVQYYVCLYIYQIHLCDWKI